MLNKCCYPLKQQKAIIKQFEFVYDTFFSRKVCSYLSPINEETMAYVNQAWPCAIISIKIRLCSETKDNIRKYVITIFLKK